MNSLIENGRSLKQRAVSAQPVFWVLIIIVLLLTGAALSLKLGVKQIEWYSLLHALFQYDPTNSDHVIVRYMRLPRLIAALLVGASLAIAGVLMQTISRNPLADPGIVGVNAGAAVAVVSSVIILGSASPALYIWPAIAGRCQPCSFSIGWCCHQRLAVCTGQSRSAGQPTKSGCLSPMDNRRTFNGRQ